MKDIQQLKLGHKVSSCFSYLLYQKDSIATALEKKGAKSFPAQNDYLFPEEVVTYSTKNQILVRYRTTFDFMNLCYMEALPNIQWNLSDEHDNILGYNCQKALCEFRGRKYIAWYSTEIPISAGPYKFHEAVSSGGGALPQQARAGGRNRLAEQRRALGQGQGEHRQRGEVPAPVHGRKDA